MKPVNIENIESLLNKIWNGELNHNQQEFFCGTSACLAGWDLALYLEESPSELEDKGYCPWKWSKENNNLEKLEAFLLFSPESTKFLHKAVLQAFKKGKRLTGEEIYPFLVMRNSVEEYNEDFDCKEAYTQGEVKLSLCIPLGEHKENLSKAFDSVCKFFEGIENVVIDTDFKIITFLPIKEN
jgi:hypothetical protein